MKNMGSKVADFLNKLKTDDRFQISLSSEVQRKSDDKFTGEDVTNVTFDTDLDVEGPPITESRFIPSLQSTLTSNEDENE